MAALLRRRADSDPDGVGWHFAPGGPVTHRELWTRALERGGGLQQHGVKPGDVVLILEPDVRTAVEVLFGVWCAGAVPLQVGAPYRAEALSGFRASLSALATRVGARRLVISDALRAYAEGATGVVCASALTGERAAPAPAPGPAFLQLTSGSVSRPRAVAVGGDALLDHLAAIAHRLPATSEDHGVTWLPLFHDMGLVGGLLYPLFTGFPVTMLSPLAFRADPFQWLQTLSKVRASHTMAPPSAYAVVTGLAARAERESLNLGALRCAMVGAEPIPPSVLRAFSGAFASCGFRDEAWFPVYGLAEATVAVTFPPVDTPPRVDRVRGASLRCGHAEPGDDVDLTGVGSPLPGVDLRVVDGAGQPVPDRVVGEIWVRTRHGMAGYHGEPERTAAAYVDGWLVTGDLGYLADGTLFVTGRTKELIVRGGHNLLPWRLEDVAQGVDGVRRGCVAAVGVDVGPLGTQRAVVVAETRYPESDHAGLARAIRHALAADGQEVDAVRVVPPGWLPKTSSGKLRRRAVAERLVALRWV